MTVALAFLTYMDRVCISVTAPAIVRDLRLSNIQMGFVFSAFTAAYALFEIPTGWWADRIGSRLVLTRIVTWWSIFTGLTGVAWNFPSLLALRALFGAGEAGAWPTVARALSRWFPEQERGTAQGIFFWVLIWVADLPQSSWQPSLRGSDGAVPSRCSLASDLFGLCPGFAGTGMNHAIMLRSRRRSLAGSKAAGGQHRRATGQTYSGQS